MAKLLKYDKNGEETITSTGRQHNPSKDIPISEINRRGEEQEIPFARMPERMPLPSDEFQSIGREKRDGEPPQYIVIDTEKK